MSNTKRFLKIPMTTKQQVKNCIMETLDTKESKKCIKKEKKLDVEKIFIKKTNFLKKNKK
tara:strand:- start:1942 stop:2121 length:180 start_codon:yes stop_codon:yes gene_type:complete